jgi:hypothetical protein
MKTLKNFLIIICLLSINYIFSTERELYVDNFSNILGTYHLETELLEFAKNHEINTLILYDLHKINKRFPLGDETKNGVLASFIVKAKVEYGIQKISASGESSDFFINAIHAYNTSRTKTSEKFDIYNLEYEYWDEESSSNNGYYCKNFLKDSYEKCNRENSFKFYVESLITMRRLADEIAHPVKVEAYIGKFTEKEVQNVSDHVDRLLIHAYVKTPQESFHYVKNRLDLLAGIDSKIQVSILYSSEMNFMGKWFKTQSFQTAEEIFFKELEKEEIELEQKLNFKGFTYYNYSYFQYSLKRFKNQRNRPKINYSPQ